MSTEKYNYLQLIQSNQWVSRVFINGNPITITIKKIFNKDGGGFIKFVDQNNEQRAILSNLIEIPTFTME